MLYSDLSDLIGFGYDLSDTQDGLNKCWKIGFIFCAKDSGERFRAQGRSCFICVVS